MSVSFLYIIILKNAYPHFEMKVHKKIIQIFLKCFFLSSWLQRSFSEINYYSAKFYLWIRDRIISSFFKSLYCCSFTVVCIFSSLLPSTPAKRPSLPCFYPPPWFCPCAPYSSSGKPFSPLSPPQSTLAIVRLFLIWMSLVIFCLLFSSVDYIPVEGEIIWYLSLTTWLISLSIMLSSSIHTVPKGRNAFFLSAM